MSVRLTCDTCGHSHDYKTRKVAAQHFPRHSCANRLARQAGIARRIARAQDPGTEAPCTHATHHPHGTKNRYQLDGCTCRRCRDAKRDYERARERRILYGLPGNLVDAAPVRDHIRSLGQQGMGWKRVAEQAGVSWGVVSTILYGRNRADTASKHTRPPRIRLTRSIAERLLAVTLDLGDHTLVDATGTARRLQALAHQGWSMGRIARKLGYASASNMTRTLRASTPITVAKRREVSNLYDKLWDTPPPANTVYERQSVTRTKRYAASQGWVPPLAWDDDTIDDPQATPDVGEVSVRRGPRNEHGASLLDRLEDLLHVAPDSTFRQAELRLDARKDTIEKACHRGGRRDLLAQLTRNRMVDAGESVAS